MRKKNDIQPTKELKHLSQSINKKYMKIYKPESSVIDKQSLYSVKGEDHVNEARIEKAAQD